jgi:hypothetical protein
VTVLTDPLLATTDSAVTSTTTVLTSLVGSGLGGL